MALSVQLPSVRENASFLMLVEYTGFLAICLWEEEPWGLEIRYAAHESLCSGRVRVMGSLFFSIISCLLIIPENL